MASGVANSAAMMRSPSFSRCSSSTTTTIPPRATASTASSIVDNGMRASSLVADEPTGRSAGIDRGRDAAIRLRLGHEHQLQVVAEPLDRLETAAPHTRHAGSPAAGKHRNAVVASEEGGRHVEHVAVDEAEAVEPAGHGGATFDEELEHATTAELVEHGAGVAGELEGRLHGGPGRRPAEHDPQRLAERAAGLARRRTHGEQRVVGPHGARPDEHGVALGPEALDVGARLGSGDPPARAVRGGEASVERGGELQHDEGPPRPSVAEVGLEEPGRLVGEDAEGHLDAGRPQHGEPAARDTLVGVDEGGDDPAHARLDEGLCARRSAAVVRTGLEDDVGGAAVRTRPRREQRRRLGVRAARRRRGALAGHGPVRRHDDAADPGVRRRLAANRRGKREGAAHEGLVAFLRAASLASVRAGAQWGRPPAKRSSACGTTSSTASRHSVAPPVEPGKLSTRALPFVPATARERRPSGLTSLMASASPGASRSSTWRVPSGVWSRGPKPVPPVVTSSPTNPADIASRAAATDDEPSGITRFSTISKPLASSSSAMAPPLRSSRVPLATPSETVSTLALSSSVTRHSARPRAPPSHPRGSPPRRRAGPTSRTPPSRRRNSARRPRP